MPSATIESSGSSPRVRPAAEDPHLASSLAQVSPAEIAQRAYQLYLQRGGAHGNDVEDWLVAESELLRERNTAPRMREA
jgi:hypothetical protein